jgi:hypothetical protein
MLPARALGAAARFGFLIKLTELVEIFACGHEEKFLKEAKIIPRGSAGILAKVAGLSTESGAVEARNSLQFHSELVSPDYSCYEES